MNKTVNLLTFLQNGNVVRITEEDFNRFLAILVRHGLDGLLRGKTNSYQGYVSLFVMYNKGDLLIKKGLWDGTTLYAECQIGKEGIAIYPYDEKAVVAWYGCEPLSVDDIDDR